MDKKNSEIEGFDYPDLDLSDQQPPSKSQNDKQPSGDPTKKNKIDESIQKNNQVQNKTYKSQKQSSNPVPASKTQVPFFPPPPPGSQNKGPTTWVPPPPMVQRTAPVQQNYPRPQYQKHQYNQNRDNRQKKNTVYVKNIPKSFNTPDKLMTFFKNEGAIKQIKVNQAEQSAVIRFVKEENAAKFLKSSKIIFNRSYIVYGENQNLSLTQQQINDRINDELGNVKKAEKTNLKVLRQKVSNQLAQNIRALYFLENHLIDEDTEELKSLRNQIKKEIQSKCEMKRLLEIQNNQEVKPEECNTAHYNWSLVFVKKSNSGIDRKSLFAEFMKHGPLISIDYQCLTQKPMQTQTQNQQSQDAPKSLLDYKIKVLFLSIKHAWSIYKAKKDEMGLTVQGIQVHKYFESGKLKTVQLKKTHQTESGSQTLTNASKPQSQVLEKEKPENQNVLENENVEATPNEQSVNQ